MLRWFTVLLALAGGASTARADDLAAGAKAPDFALIGMDGRHYRLSDFVGKHGFVLAWFPKAFTAG
jgi:peroxiredoxin Q/BCP